MFGHLSAVRNAAPGQWVRACAPALVDFYLAMQARYFAGEGAESAEAAFALPAAAALAQEDAALRNMIVTALILGAATVLTTQLLRRG